MGWSIQLRNHSDPSVVGVGDKILDILRCVNLVWGVGAISAEVRERGKLKGEALRIGYVPVKHIHLGEAQRVNNLQDNSYKMKENIELRKPF